MNDRLIGKILWVKGYVYDWIVVCYCKSVVLGRWLFWCRRFVLLGYESGF